MAELFKKTSELQKADEAFSEIGVQMSAIKTNFDGLKGAERTIRDLETRTKSNLNAHSIIKMRGGIIIIAAMMEALLSVRVFGFILHGALNIPMTSWMWIVDFVVGMVFSWAIIHIAIALLLYEKELFSVREPKMGYVVLFLVPLINLFIFYLTDDKKGEFVFLGLSFITLVINIIVVRLVAKSKADERFDKISEADGTQLENARKNLESLHKKFNAARHRVELISPAFVTAYVKIHADEKKLVNYPVDYLYILQERIFNGKISGLIDTSKVVKANYPFIIDWEKAESKLSLI